MQSLNLETAKVALSVPKERKNSILHSLELAVGYFSYLPFHLYLCPHPPTIQPSSGSHSCVFEVITQGSQVVCTRACHKQSIGMRSSLVHGPHPVKRQTEVNEQFEEGKKLQQL